jgi:hypothetical protein
MPTSNVTPKVTAKIALMFLLFLLDKDLHAIRKLDFNVIKTSLS